MGHEISEFDITDHQLLEDKTPQRSSMSTDLGEAKVIYTVFGKARVKIIHKQDNTRRTWLLAALALAAIFAAVWLGWSASQQTEPQAGIAPALPISAIAPNSPTDVKTEHVLPAPTPPLASGKPIAPTHTAIANTAIGLTSAPQPHPGSGGVVQIAAEPLAATDNQTVKQSAPAQHVAVATHPAKRAEANKPASPSVEPTLKENTPIPPSSGNNPAPGSASAQP